MIVNAFNILDQELNSIATGIYLGVSITDHSCKPNAVATFDGTTLFIRTIEDLPSIDWSKVRHIDQVFLDFFIYPFEIADFYLLRGFDGPNRYQTS